MEHDMEAACNSVRVWGFPKVRGTILGSHQITAQKVVRIYGLAFKA